MQRIVAGVAFGMAAGLAGWVGAAVPHPNPVELTSPVFYMNASGLTVAGGQVYFTGWDGTNRRLFRTGGTTQTTVRVSPNSVSNAAGMRTLGDKVVFAAEDLSGNRELWVADATTGASMVADLYPGNNGRPNSSSPEGFTRVGDALYFTAVTGTTGRELWKTDGTAGGTSMVADLYPGFGSGNPYELTAVGDRLYFWAEDGEHGTELWTVDPEPAGSARVVKDLNPGVYSSPVQRLTGAGGVVYFTHGPGSNVGELWRSDGSESGTGQVVDLSPGPGTSDPSWMAAQGNRLVFAANAPDGERTVYRTDGTDVGTERLVAGSDPNRPRDPAHFLEVRNYVFFDALDAGGHRGLWGIHGDDVFTFPDVVDEVGPMEEANGYLFFQTRKPVDGAPGWYTSRLWLTDGTDEGVRLVMNVPGFTTSWAPSDVVGVGDMIFLTAPSRTGVYGFQDDTQVYTFTLPAIVPEPGGIRVAVAAAAVLVGVRRRRGSSPFSGRAEWRG